jgi:hypothetical protein
LAIMVLRVRFIRISPARFVVMLVRSFLRSSFPVVGFSPLLSTRRPRSSSTFGRDRLFSFACLAALEASC